MSRKLLMCCLLLPKFFLRRNRRHRRNEDIQASPTSLRECFSDGKRRVDFVIAYDENILDDPKKSEALESFTDNLQEKGFQFEVAHTTVYKDIAFLLIHGPDDVVIKYANIYSYNLSFQNPNFRSDKYFKSFNVFENELTRCQDSHLFIRSPVTLSGERPKKVTNSEKSGVLDLIMEEIWFGRGLSDFGLKQLKNLKIVKKAYSLHDGTHKWTEEGELNDRQLLGKYWANYKMFYKKQPLNLIERYFGPEIGFFFAWMEFYIIMLIIPAIIGLLTYAFGFLYFLQDGRINDICNSELELCPNCPPESNCSNTKLSDSCILIQSMHSVDNVSSIIFAMFMSVWATLLYVLWKRREHWLLHHWNLEDVKKDRSIRLEYCQHMNSLRMSSRSGIMEHCVSRKKVFINYTISYLTCTGLLVFLLLVIFCIYVFNHVAIPSFLRDCSGACRLVGRSAITVVLLIGIMEGLETAYTKISIMMTNLECHRTRVEHENSKIYKNFHLQCLLKYFALIYLAFFKGKLYTYPGDAKQYKVFFGIATDKCPPTGCLFDLAALLLSQLNVKILNAVLNIVISYAFHKLKKLKRRHNAKTRWEDEYTLDEPPETCLFHEMTTLYIHHGWLIFFVAICPLAPLCILIYEAFSLRTIAIKLVYRTHRPVARKIAGLEAWNTILSSLTFTSMITNAILIAFTSDVISRLIYFHEHLTMEGYIQTTLSVRIVTSTKNINQELFDQYFARYHSLQPSTIIILNRRINAVYERKNYFDGGSKNGSSICYYIGRRYPPDHNRAYQLTDEYWFHFAMKMLFVAVFEHVIIIIKNCLVYAIPEVPSKVKDKIFLNEQLIRNERINILNKEPKKEVIVKKHK